jgi:predicted nucleic acid-binding protein
MSRVFWDTNLFVYLVEDKGTRADQVVALRQWMIERKDDLLTSALTLGEVLVKPIEAGDEELRRRYEHAIGAGATVLPFDAPVAPIFAEIRRDRSIRAPDAIQLACASAAGTDLFITNDDRLSKKNIRGIQFIQSLEKATP